MYKREKNMVGFSPNPQAISTKQEVDWKSSPGKWLSLDEAYYAVSAYMGPWDIRSAWGQKNHTEPVSSYRHPSGVY